MTPDPGSEEEPVQYLAARVREAIASDERTHVLDVDVRIVGGQVFLRGQVPNDERRSAIEEVARGVVEGLQIHNEVEVFGAEPAGVEEVT